MQLYCRPVSLITSSQVEYIRVCRVEYLRPNLSLFCCSLSTKSISESLSLYLSSSVYSFVMIVYDLCGLFILHLWRISVVVLAAISIAYRIDYHLAHLAASGNQSEDRINVMQCDKSHRKDKTQILILILIATDTNTNSKRRVTEQTSCTCRSRPAAHISQMPAICIIIPMSSSGKGYWTSTEQQTSVAGQLSPSLALAFALNTYWQRLIFIPLTWDPIHTETSTAPNCRAVIGLARWDRSLQLSSYCL